MAAKKGRPSKMNEKLAGTIIARPRKKFNMFDAIKESPLRPLQTANTKDTRAREFLESELTHNTAKGSIYPGMMIMFNYYVPKTMKQLEYYDAAPCTIFFGIVDTKDGKRVLGFNIHYYPPRLRYKLIDWIYKTFKSFFISDWSSIRPKEISGFNYKYITSQLSSAGLEFGVREYIPSLMGDVKKIPPKYFQVAVFTEGMFKKETRKQILSYWTGKGKKI